ncbi:MAG: hypothetical protein JWO59_1760 [Chloroflexi bacterium]|nr:hypothetical protein [Chloroflexota bacterium]
MHRFGHFGKRLCISLGLVALTSLAQATPIGATADAGVAFAAGTLSGGAITFSNFGGVTLNATRQTTTATWSIANISDARGTGTGWHLSLTLAQLAEYNTGTTSYVAGGKKLPTSSVTVFTAPTVSLVDLSSSATNTITPVSAGTALDTGSPVKLLSAAIGGGMGTYSFGAMTVSLSDPATTYARTYETDATVTLEDAP